MSTALVISTDSDAYNKPIVSGVKAALRDDVQIVEVGDELDLPYGARTAAAKPGVRVVVALGAVIGTDGAAALPALTQALFRVGLDGATPVVIAVAAYANDMVARRVDARTISDSIVTRVNLLTGGGGGGGGGSVAGGRPAPSSYPAAGTSRVGAGAPPPPAAGGYGSGSYSGGSAGVSSVAPTPRKPAAGGAGGSSLAAPAPAAPASPYRGPVGGVYTAKTLGVEATLATLREQLKKHGANGIFGLARKFKIMDDDNTKQITYPEFSKAMRETEVFLDEAAQRQLFKYFDYDGDGTLSYDEFLVGVRGELDERRKALVDQAFAIIDKDGNGLLELSDIMSSYDASKHPDVISGKKTKNEVFREFLDNFDGGDKDGVVTPEEFEHYYGCISASIDDDDYFELMIRNAWHMSGGEGWAANTTCRRVLVTRRDGSQQVVELRNDIGIGNDINAIKAALRKQGEDFTAVSLYDADDTTTPAARPSTAPSGGRFGASKAHQRSQISFA